MNYAYVIATIVLAAMGVIGSTAGLLRYTAKRGASNAELVSATRENTEATRNLGTQVGKLGDGLADLRNYVQSEFRLADVRLTRLEADDGRATALRDAGTR
jgi:hypothetical protein